MNLEHYIPTIQFIKKTHEMNIIKQFPLPDEIIRMIISYYGIYIGPSDSKDKYWIHLGIETCNLRKWRFNCSNILDFSFGKTEYKYVSYLDNLFSELAHHLDELVWKYYPDTQTIRRGNGYIHIDDIFYNIRNIIEYPIEDDYGWNTKKNNKQYKGTLTSYDKQYIVMFVKRCIIYLNYLKQTINTLQICISRRRTLLKTIHIFQKKCDKMYENIKNITVKERIK